MILSCLAHFAWWLQPASDATRSVLTDIAMIATPMFLLLSGTMTGLLLARGDGGRLPVRYVLLNRGLFLMIFGHALVALAEARSLLAASIVDDIGVSLILIATFYTALKSEEVRVRVAYGALVVYGVLWIAALVWRPDVGAALRVKQALIGPNLQGAMMHTYTAPSLQYVTFYLMGLPMGDVIRRKMNAPDFERRLALLALRAGATLIGAVMLVRLLRVLIFGSGSVPLIDWTLTIAAKIPPSPAYLAFHVGLALLIVSALFELARRRSMHGLALISWFAVIGRASLFCFVLQYFVLWTLPDLLHLTPSLAAAPLLFAGAIAILWVAAYGWTRIRGNRWMTVGLKPPASVRVD